MYAFLHAFIETIVYAFLPACIQNLTNTFMLEVAKAT